MDKALFKVGNLVRGFAKILEGSSVKQGIHDGDTVSVVVDGSSSIRFLGVDTPEVSFGYPKLDNDPDGGDGGKWLSISNEKFQKYLAKPFDSQHSDSQKYKDALGSKLVSYLEDKLNANTAKNHHDLAMKAHRKLERIVEADVQERENQNMKFRFFMAFAFEILDRYGRFLCYLDRDNNPQERQGRISYSERMLETGFAAPYFIWPNLNPFMKSGSIVEAVPDINNFQETINKSKRLCDARNFVKKARDLKIGIFNKSTLLLLSLFELRYLARRGLPDRYVLDMSVAKPKLISPVRYHEIKNIEDRLFIPEEYAPLFKEHGYEVEL